MGELKKVLTPQVLHADREAVRMITRHVQQEETWKEAWRNFELDRRDGLLTDLEHRQADNAMLQEMSGQLPRPRKDPRRHLPNSCTKRVGHLALPKQPRHHGNVTQLSDYRGLTMWTTIVPWRLVTEGLARHMKHCSFHEGCTPARDTVLHT